MRFTRTALAATSIAASALLLAGCSGGSSQSSDSANGKTTLTITVWNYKQTPEFKALFDAFEKANPKITIKPVDILAQNYEDKITAMLSGGDSTDIITVKNLTDFGGYVSKKQFQPVDDVAKKLPADKIPALADYKADGHYYATPYRQDFGVLFYNKTMFKDAGLPDPANLTWQEFAQDAKKLTHGTKGKKVYGAYIHTWNSMVQGYASAQAGRSLNKPPYNYLSTQYKTILGMQKAGTIMKWGVANSQQVSYQTELETGKAAMVPMGTWLIAPLLADEASGATKIDWGIAPVPQLSAGTPITTDGGPTGFGINKNAKDTAAAKKFLAFAAGPEGAKAVASIGIVPAYHSDAITDEYFGLKGMPQDATSKKAFNPDVIKPDGPTGARAAAVNNVLNQEHQLIMTGNKSISAGIAEMNKRVKQEVLDQ